MLAPGPRDLDNFSEIEQRLATLSNLCQALRRSEPSPLVARIWEELISLQGPIEDLLDIVRKRFDWASTTALEASSKDSYLKVLQTIARAFAIPSSDLAKDVLQRLVDATNAKRGLVALRDSDETRAVPLAAVSFPSKDLHSHEYETSRTLLKEVLIGTGPILLDNISNDEYYSSITSVRAQSIEALLAVPLVDRGRTAGAIVLEKTSPGSIFSSEDQELVEVAATLLTSRLVQTGAVSKPTNSLRSFSLDPAGTNAKSAFVGRDPAFLKILREIEAVAGSDAPVLIEGESGTGKELVAQTIHQKSRRRDAPIVAVNCAAIPESLFESEFFGHERGAFTGAHQRLPGRIDQAERGTLFLDEIQALDLGHQSKLLRYLETGEYQSVGGHRTKRGDTRIVTATSENLEDLVAQNLFHKALFYRIRVLPIMMPPLRHRVTDIPLLLEHFLKIFCTKENRTRRFNEITQDILRSYDYPGNVRELKNLVYRLVVMSEGPLIGLADLPPEILERCLGDLSLKPHSVYSGKTWPTTLQGIDELEKRFRKEATEQRQSIARLAVKEAGGNVTAAAERLGLHRSTVHRLIGT